MKQNLTFFLSILVFTSCSLFASCNSKKDEIKEGTPQPIGIIFDTDMGNDIDDALALDMLFKYMDEDKVNLLAIMNNKGSKFATPFLDIMCTWYGYPSIPIGRIENGVLIDDYVDYAMNVCKLEEDGKALFTGSRSEAEHENLLLAYKLYRKVLAEQPDSSVTIISVGFSTNLARLLETGADEYSPLSGVDLVKQKVKLLSVMGGSFGEKKRKEFNIINDVEAARKVFDKWPTKIVLSPFEVGAKVQFPAKAIQENFTWTDRHPLVHAYHNYRPMPYDRATWDLTSVLYVGEPEENFMTKSETGRLTVTEDGYTDFVPEENGRDIVLSVDSIQAPKMKEYFIQLISKRPKNKEEGIK